MKGTGSDRISTSPGNAALSPIAPTARDAAQRIPGVDAASNPMTYAALLRPRCASTTGAMARIDSRPSSTNCMTRETAGSPIRPNPRAAASTTALFLLSSASRRNGIAAASRFERADAWQTRDVDSPPERPEMTAGPHPEDRDSERANPQSAPHSGSNTAERAVESLLNCDGYRESRQVRQQRQRESTAVVHTH